MSKSKFLITVLISMWLVGCKAVPMSYRGSYVDAEHGNQLRLKRGKGVLTFADGRVLIAKTERIKFDDLLEGQGGIYVDRIKTKGESTVAEVNWIIPDPASKKEVAGFVWFESEVIYTALDLGAAKKSGITLMHCKNGIVTLDTVSKQWQVGCRAGSAELNFARTN